MNNRNTFSNLYAIINRKDDIHSDIIVKWLISFTDEYCTFKNIAAKIFKRGKWHFFFDVAWQPYPTIAKIKSSQLFDIKVVDENSIEYKEVFLDLLNAKRN